MQHTSNSVLHGGADRGAGFRSHQSRAGSPKHLFRFAVTTGDEIGLSETIFGKVEPAEIAPLLRQTDDLLAGGNCLDRRVVEVLRRGSDRHGGDFALDVIDRVGAPFRFLSEVQPFGDPAGSHIRHARFDPQVDGFGFALTGNRRAVEGIHGDLEMGGRIGKRRSRDALSRHASAVGERLGPVLARVAW